MTGSVPNYQAYQKIKLQIYTKASTIKIYHQDKKAPNKREKLSRSFIPCQRKIRNCRTNQTLIANEQWVFDEKNQNDLVYIYKPITRYTRELYEMLKTQITQTLREPERIYKCPRGK